MTHPPINFREERDLGQKLNVTFGFIRQNYKVLLTSVLYFVAPCALLAGIFSGLYQSTALAHVAGNPEYESPGAFYFANTLTSLNYWLQILFTVMSYVLLSLIVYSVIIFSMDEEGEIQVRDVWRGIKAHFIPVLYSGVGVLVICVLATLLLILPGIYVSVALSLFIIVMVREDIGFVETMERCFYLVKGNWWPTFGFLLVVVLIQGVLGFVASLPAVILYIMRILHLPGGENDLLLVIASILSTIVNLLLYILTITAVAFHYFNLVEIKEGIGLLEQVHNIGKPEPVAITEEEKI